MKKKKKINKIHRISDRFPCRREPTEKVWKGTCQITNEKRKIKEKKRKFRK